MPQTPRPEGWKGGREDFTFVRSFEGHLSIGIVGDDPEVVDIAYKRNARTFSEADLSGCYCESPSEGEGY